MSETDVSFDVVGRPCDYSVPPTSGTVADSLLVMRCPSRELLGGQKPTFHPFIPSRLKTWERRCWKRLAIGNEL